MAIDPTYFELFINGKDFDQILFLDNFHKRVDVSKETEQDLINLLTQAINHSENIYIKRSAFKLLSEISLSLGFSNSFATISILQNFLFCDQSILQIIGLKYFPYFQYADTSENCERIKKLSDSKNGDIASEAYFCLGIMESMSDISDLDIAKCIITLKSSKPFFKAASLSVENRVDADSFILIIDWCLAILSEDSQLIKARLEELKLNLFSRKIYEFELKNMELDLLVFQLLNQIYICFDTASKAKFWLDIPSQIQNLLNNSIEIQRIRSSSHQNRFLLDKLYEGLFQKIENSIYQAHLFSEKSRLLALKTKTTASSLQDFIENLIRLFPSTNFKTASENPELLALLAENQGMDIGFDLYNKISNKTISPEVLKTLSTLLQKSRNNQLPFRTGSILGQEILFSLISEIESHLPDYPTEKLEIFSDVIEEVIRYSQRSFTGSDRKRFSFLFTEKLDGKGQKALEIDLQNSMILFFEHSKIADGLDHEKAKFVDGGRVDILYKKDLITIPIELKKSLERPDKITLEKNYIAQAQTYTAGYHQLGIFVLLELSDKSNDPPPNFKDWFRVHHLPPSSNLDIRYPDYIISVVIPGNRTTPSSKSTYK